VQDTQWGDLSVISDINLPTGLPRMSRGHSAHSNHSISPNGRCRLIYENFLLEELVLIQAPPIRCHCAQWLWTSLLSQNIINLSILLSLLCFGISMVWI
jgi:hypothetical protein